LLVREGVKGRLKMLIGGENGRSGKEGVGLTREKAVARWKLF